MKVLNDKNCIGEIQLDDFTSQVSTIEWYTRGRTTNGVADQHSEGHLPEGRSLTSPGPSAQHPPANRPGPDPDNTENVPTEKKNRKTRRRRALRRRAHQKNDPPIPTPGEQILNLSARTLTETELHVLDKGMSFVATSTRQPPRQRELERFRRNISLHLHASLQPFASFKSMMSSITTSTFNPPEYLGEKNPLWTTLLKAANPRTGPPRRNNLSKELRAAWTSLRDNPETYLTTADKRGKPVLIPREDYIREALRQLQDTDTYEELSREKAEELLLNLGKKTTAVMGKLLKGNLITRTEQRRLVEEKWEIPPIYFFPKIHKPINPTRAAQSSVQHRTC